jgi:hypothetical protein
VPDCSTMGSPAGTWFDVAIGRLIADLTTFLDPS